MWVLPRNAIKAGSPDWAAQLQECWCRGWGRGECDDIFELSLFAHLSFKTKIHQPGSHYNTHITTGYLWSLCEGVYAEQSALADVPVGRTARTDCAFADRAGAAVVKIISLHCG